MISRICVAVLTSFLITSSCEGAQNSPVAQGAVFASEQGNWVTIYQNDFRGMHYAGGLTKNAACVSEAKRKVGEFQDLGMIVRTRLLMNEMAAFEVTGRDSFLVFCNANGALVVNMMVSGQSAVGMAKNEASGTAPQIGDVKPTVSTTVVDVNTGKAVNTTVTPND